MTIGAMTRRVNEARFGTGLRALALAAAGGVMALSFVLATPVRAEDPAPAATAEAPAAPGTEATPAAPGAEIAPGTEAAPGTPAAPGTEAVPGAEGPLAESAVAPEQNPYGLAALWAQGDFVAKGTLVILGIMSMGSWYILFTKLWEQRGMFAQGRAAQKRFAQAASLKEATDGLAKNSAFRAVAEEGLAAAEQHGRGLGAEVSLLDWTGNALSRAIDGVAANLQGGLAFLATVGSTAPFVGLFGTVWGIYHALIAIGVAGQASIDKVAGPVGEALIMTAIGLAVAVPAVLGYNWLVRRNKAALDQVRRFATEVEARILAHR
ncbi:MotA/TolQ/ExbB proton channel family protein [Parvibaculum sp.]|uniref:MotA/TolQ/ExbB proton channel family protein n=1 Tax=Parvibaculum sp. TaxID=2024848 RepID=UPI002C4C5F5E|nr:MotA/TolQ/ExbB proton channel family protein [Parvibaculum sp.]HUD50330.1 MotA/TolQ/ExbB proton channel family protein [Parvibaculum sp.]